MILMMQKQPLIICKIPTKDKQEKEHGGKKGKYYTAANF